MTWLWNSMILDVSCNCMFLSSSREIWDALRQTFSKKQDIATSYELKMKIFSTKQGAMTVTDCYEILTGLQTKLDKYQNLQVECSKDASTLADFVNRDRIFEFLSGLNSEYDPIWVQILGKEKLP